MRQQHRPTARPLVEALLIAAVVGGVAYFAGFRKGVRSEQLRRATPESSAMRPRAMSGGQMPGASLDLAALTEKLAQIDDRDQLLDIANRHLAEARSSVQGQDAASAERRFQISAAAYERALELEPDDPDVLTDLGIALRGLHDPQGAVDRFREAAAADSSHAQSRFNLGLVLLSDLQQETEAVEAWKEYLETAPKADPEREFVERQLTKLEPDD